MYMFLHIKKNYFIHFCGLSLKIVESLQCILHVGKIKLVLFTLPNKELDFEFENQTKWKKGSTKQIRSNIWEFKLRKV